MINRSSRQFKITVNGLEVTSLVQYFEVGDDKVSSSGLIPTRGSIKLRYNPKFNLGRDPKISLDPKIPESASYWARGVPVKLWLNDSSLTLRKHPRHSLRILSTKFDRNELSLTIEVGCLLALLDGKQPEGDASETCTTNKDESARAVDDVVRSLLNGGAEDYPSISISYIGTIPGLIFSPKSKDNSGSFIGEAGKVAYSRGYALWVDKDENIKALKIAPENSLARMVLDADKDIAEYVRNDAEGSSSEVPYTKVRVRYTVTTIEESDPGYTLTTESYGSTEFVSNTLIHKTKVTDTVNFVRGTRTILTQNWNRISEIFPWAFSSEDGADNPLDQMIKSEEIEEEFLFEISPDVREDEACSDEGDGASQGRLLQKTKTVRRARGWAYAEWIDQHEILNTIPLKIKVDSDGLIETNAELFFQVFPLTTYLVEKTVYTFFDTDEDDGVKRIKMERQRLQSDIFPKAWKYTRRSPNVPDALINAGGIEETWRRRIGQYEWEHRRVERDVLGKANRAACDARFKKALAADFSDTIDPESNRALLVSNVRKFSEQITTTLNEVKVSNTQTIPPSPEFLPERYSRSDEEIVEEYPISSEFTTTDKGRVKEIKLDTPIERRPGQQIQSPINTVDPLSSAGLRGFRDDLEQAKETARVEALMVWGRYRSVGITEALADIWFDLPQIPLVRFDVIDYDRITEQSYRHTYLVDGWANAVTLRECLNSYDGLWQGTALNIITTEIKIAAPIPPNATFIEVEPLAFGLQEGDPVVTSVQESLSVQQSNAGSSVLGLNAATATEIVAGTQILVGGFVVTVAQTVSAGSNSIIIEEPLPTPISNNTTATAGTIETVSTHTPVGSTAIPIAPSSNTVTIEPETVTIDVETNIPPARVPVNFNAVGIGTFSTQTFTPIAQQTFTAVGIGMFPSNDFENIGTAYFNATGLGAFGTTTTLTQRLTAVGLGFHRFEQTVEFETVGQGVFNTTQSQQVEFEAIGVGTFETETSAPRVNFNAVGIGTFNTTQSQQVEFEVTGVGTHSSFNQSELDSFEIIAVW